MSKSKQTAQQSQEATHGMDFKIGVPNWKKSLVFSICFWGGEVSQFDARLQLAKFLGVYMQLGRNLFCGLLEKIEPI